MPGGSLGGINCKDSTEKAYKRNLAWFLNYLDGSKVEEVTAVHAGNREAIADELPDVDEVLLKDTARLERITAQDVCRYLNYKAYRDENPSADARPLHCRANTLDILRRSISTYMPRPKSSWDPVKLDGNPCRSKEVTDMIKGVREKEQQFQGLKSQAQRAIEGDEFMLLLKVARVHQFTKKTQLDIFKKFRLGSALTLQWQLIARIDDIHKLKFNQVQPHPLHAGTLLAELAWHNRTSQAKQSSEAPKHIILASRNPLLCPLLNMAAFIEARGFHTMDLLRPIDSVYGGWVKTTMSHALRDAFKNEKFTQVGPAAASGSGPRAAETETVAAAAAAAKIAPGKLGSYSIRTGAAIYGKRCGLPEDFVHHRGRFVSNNGSSTTVAADNIATTDMSSPSAPVLPSNEDDDDDNDNDKDDDAVDEVENENVNDALDTTDAMDATDTMDVDASPAAATTTAAAVHNTSTFKKNHILAYPDAQVAAVLAGSAGPCRYVVKEAFQDIITEEFIKETAAKHVYHIYGRDMAQVLALPLIWAAFLDDNDNSTVSGGASPGGNENEGNNDCELIPPVLKDNIKKALPTAGGRFGNPIQRVRLHISGSDENLWISNIHDNHMMAPAPSLAQDQGLTTGPSAATTAVGALGVGGQGVGAGVAGAAEIHGIRTQLFALQQQIEDVRRHNRQTTDPIFKSLKSTSFSIKYLTNIVQQLVTKSTATKTVADQQAAEDAARAVINAREPHATELENIYGGGDSSSTNTTAATNATTTTPTNMNMNMNNMNMNMNNMGVLQPGSVPFPFPFAAHTHSFPMGYPGPAPAFGVSQPFVPFNAQQGRPGLLQPTVPAPMIPTPAATAAEAATAAAARAKRLSKAESKRVAAIAAAAKARSTPAAKAKNRSKSTAPQAAAAAAGLAAVQAVAKAAVAAAGLAAVQAVAKARSKPKASLAAAPEPAPAGGATVLELVAKARSKLATLSEKPGGLHDLWREYQYGIDGRIPARLFTSSERGKLRHTYSRRKPFWDLVVNMMKQHHTVDSAIDMIQDVYRKKNLTDILRGIVKDKAHGGHDRLKKYYPESSTQSAEEKDIHEITI
jgi:hypothetical protein